MKKPPPLGAGNGTRTCDLLITNQLLYQLSYTSVFSRLKYYITKEGFRQHFFRGLSRLYIT